MSIDTGNHPPVKLRLYRTPLAKCPIVDKAVNDMLAANIIHPSRSPWSFPIVIADKKYGTKSYCTDLRKLNNISNEEDKEKTAFTYHRGLYEYNVMPFGLTNAPVIFKEFM